MSYWNDPVRNVEAITPSDSVDLTAPTHGIYVGVGGNVAVETENGSTATFTSVLAGSIIPVRAIKVLSTNTTATTLLAMW